MGRSQRQKGKVGEQRACTILRPLFPEVRTKRAGGESATQDRGRDLLGTPGLCVQVQVSGRPTIDRKMREAIRAAARPGGPPDFTPGELAIALTHRDGIAHHPEPWLVTMRAEDFLELMRFIAQECGKPCAEYDEPSWTAARNVARGQRDDQPEKKPA